MEKAGISLGKHVEDWRMTCLRGLGYILLWGGATEEPEFLLAEEVHRAGLCEDGARAAGGGMKRLRKQTGKCRQAAALGSATVQVGRSLRSGAAVLGFWEDWRAVRWLRGGEGQGLGHRRGGDATAQVLPGSYSPPGVRATGR